MISDPGPLTFKTALVLRSDGGPDQILYSAQARSAIRDAGSFAEPYVGFDAGLGPVAAHCGDVLVLQVTQLSDAGQVIEAFPYLSIP